jgi:hypothetical protein
MKQFLAAIAIICALVVGTSIFLPGESWLFVYGTRAEEYSQKLLLGETPSTPTWATNLVVNKVKDIVTFGNHDSSIIFAFSPKGSPQLYDLEWSKKWGNWYVSQIKT